jgi:glutamine cyclotransferase
MIKKVVALVCASVMLMGSAMPAYAAPSPSSTVTIIEKTEETEKIFTDNLKESDKKVIETVNASVESSVELKVEDFNTFLKNDTEVQIAEGYGSEAYPDATFATGFDEAVAVVNEDGTISFPKDEVEVDVPYLGKEGLNLSEEDLAYYMLAVFNPDLGMIAYVDLASDAYNKETKKVTLPFGGLVALVEKNAESGIA